MVSGAPSHHLVLASASPGRLALLRAAGLAPEVVASGVAEDAVTGPTPAATAQARAERKARAVAPRRTTGGAQRTVVVGCDSLLSIDGEARGKPASAAEARAWWQAQRGRSGVLVTGHAVVEVASGRCVTGVAETVVRFGSPTEAEIEAYIATGEPLAVAGACTIDGYGAPFVDGIDGDPGNVVGLSLPLLRQLLAELGVAITDLWDLSR